MILGLLMANGLPRRAGIKRKLLTLHESFALVGLVAIGVHGVTLLGDTYLKPSLAQIAVPFDSSYRPGFTGLGVIAGYLAVALGLSYYARRVIGVRRWRTIHRATIVVWALGVIHVLGSGTDAGQIWLRAILALSALPIVFLFLLRVLPRDPSAAGRRRAATEPLT